MKVKGAISQDIFLLCLWCCVRKFYSTKAIRYLHNLFGMRSKHLGLNEDFDYYENIDGLHDIIGDEGIWNLNMDY